MLPRLDWHAMRMAHVVRVRWPSIAQAPKEWAFHALPTPPHSHRAERKRIACASRATPRTPSRMTPGASHAHGGATRASTGTSIAHWRAPPTLTASLPPPAWMIVSVCLATMPASTARAFWRAARTAALIKASDVYLAENISSLAICRRDLSFSASNMQGRTMWDPFAFLSCFLPDFGRSHLPGRLWDRLD